MHEYPASTHNVSNSGRNPLESEPMQRFSPDMLLSAVALRLSLVCAVSRSAAIERSTALQPSSHPGKASRDVMMEAKDFWLNLEWALTCSDGIPDGLCMVTSRAGWARTNPKGLGEPA